MPKPTKGKGKTRAVALTGVLTEHVNSPTTSNATLKTTTTAEKVTKAMEFTKPESSPLAHMKKESEEPGRESDSLALNDRPRAISPGTEEDNEALAIKLMESLESMMGICQAREILVAINDKNAQATNPTVGGGASVPQTDLEAAESIIMLHALPRHLQDGGEDESATTEGKDEIKATGHGSNESGSPLVTGTPPAPSSSRSSPMDTDIPDVNVDKEGGATTEQKGQLGTQLVAVPDQPVASVPSFGTQFQFTFSTIASQSPEHSDDEQGPILSKDVEKNATKATGLGDDLHKAMDGVQAALNPGVSLATASKEYTKLPHPTKPTDSAEATNDFMHNEFGNLDDSRLRSESPLSSLQDSDFDMNDESLDVPHIRPEQALPIDNAEVDEIMGNAKDSNNGTTSHSISASSAQTPMSIIDPHTPSASEIAAGVSTDNCGACKRAVPSIHGGSRSHIVATLWIRCDGCKTWYHNVCVNISEKEITDIDKYHCAACIPLLGPTTYRRKSSRAHTSIDYVSMNAGSQAPFKAAGDSTQHPYVEPIGKMQFLEDKFPRLNPEVVDLEFFENGDGFSSPVIIPASLNSRPWDMPDIAGEATGTASGSGDNNNDGVTDALKPTRRARANPDEDGIGMIMPKGLTVRKVAELVGFEEKVEVLDVLSQSQDKKTWDFFEWVDYFESPVKDRVKNVISQEVSHTELAKVVQRPDVVRKLDLAESVWPADMQSTFPKVQLYCLMSVANSYTDFHIDFGGSSVFYHIVSGKKSFIFIPPTKHNLSKYEAWSKMPDQNSIWYPGTLGSDSENGEDLCYRVDLSAGDTMLIPSGWIHAVLTPADSLVIGGNFLTRLALEQQIKIVEIEKSTKVHVKFRYPQFQKVMWFLALDYLQNDPLPEALLDNDQLSLVPNDETTVVKTYSKHEMDGWPHLSEFLLRTALIILGVITDGISADTRNRVRASIPKNITDPLSTVQLFGRWMAWKRKDGIVPKWAAKGWVPEKTVHVLSAKEKKMSYARREQFRKAQEAKARGEGTGSRAGLRQVKAVEETPSPATTPRQPITLKFTSDTKAAAEKLMNSAKPKPSLVKARPVRAPQPARSLPPTPIPNTNRKIATPTAPSSSQKPTRHRMSFSSTSTPTASGSQMSPGTMSTPSAKLPAGFKMGPLSQELALNLKQKYGAISSPKASILGPKRTACDECRRQKVACKHKDVVAQAEEELIKVIAKPSTPGSSRTTYKPVTPGSASSSLTTPTTGDKPYRISKNGRPVACDACKRSRRRCTHNGQEDFPPARKRTNLLRGTAWEKPPAPLPEPPVPKLYPFNSSQSAALRSERSDRSSPLSSLDSDDVGSLDDEELEEEAPIIDDRAMKLAQLALQQDFGDEGPVDTFSFSQPEEATAAYEPSTSEGRPILTFPGLIYTGVDSNPPRAPAQDYLSLSLPSPPPQASGFTLPNTFEPALQPETVTPSMMERQRSPLPDEAQSLMQPTSAVLQAITDRKRPREDDDLLEQGLADGDAHKSKRQEMNDAINPAANLEPIMDGIEASRQLQNSATAS